MKKTLMLLAILQIVTLSLFANGTVTKKYDFGSIKSIEAGSIFSIEVTEGNEKGVTIVCDEAYEEHIEVKYFQGELILSMKPNVKMLNNKEGIKVYLQMPTIEDIELSGAANLTATGTFKTRELDIELSGATSVKGLQISGSELTIECSGASTIKLDGSTSYFKSETSGASNLKAKDYSAKDGYAEVTGASSAKVRCTGTLKIMVSKMSSITHYGNPNIVNVDRGSNIRKGDD